MQQSSLARDYNDNHDALRRAFLFIEDAHKGVNRLRANDDGTLRSYDHHPIEVALLYAEMEILTRRRNERQLTDSQVADSIIRIVEHAAQRDKESLKQRLVNLSQRLTGQQLTIVIGLLCHDTIEGAYNRKTPMRQKKVINAVKRKQIRALCVGAEHVVACLTDSRKNQTAEDKKRSQLRLARKDRRYAHLKAYDVLVNMYDETLIADSNRAPNKKREAIHHHHQFMRAAYNKKHISHAMMLAAERMYTDGAQRLSLA